MIICWPYDYDSTEIHNRRSRPSIMYNKQNIPFKQNILFNKPHKVPHYMNLVPFQKELPHPCASDRLCADKEPRQWVRGLISGRCLLLLIPLIPLSFLTPLFCSSVLTPFPFLSLQAPPEQVGLLAPQNRAVFSLVFSAAENVIKSRKNTIRFFILRHNIQSPFLGHFLQSSSPASCATCSRFPRSRH